MLHICYTIEAVCYLQKQASTHCLYKNFVLYNRYTVVSQPSHTQRPCLGKARRKGPRIGVTQRRCERFVRTFVPVGSHAPKKTDEAVSKRANGRQIRV
jgi:hypothetical protein